MRLKRYGAAGAALALALGVVVVVPTAAHAAAGSVGGVVGFDSSEPGATGLPEGARVILSKITMGGEAVVGDVYTDVTLAQTQIDSAGQFSLSVPVSSGLAAAAAENGNSLNLRVTAVYATPMTSSGYSVYTDSDVITAHLTSVGTWEFSDPAGAPGEPTPDPNPDPALEEAAPYMSDGGEELPMLQSIDGLSLALRRTDSVPLDAAPSGTPVGLSGGSCDITEEVVRTEREPEVIGELHTGYDANAVFTYGKTADTHVTIGKSSNNATWKPGLAIEVNNTRGSVVTASHTPRMGYQWKSEFKWEKIRQRVYCPGYSNTYFWFIEIRTWLGSMYKGADKSASDTNEYLQIARNRGFADRYDRDTSQSRSSYKAATFEASTMGVVGIMKVRTGHTSDSDIKWTFGVNTSTHWLFNTVDYPFRAKKVYAN